MIPTTKAAPADAATRAGCARPGSARQAFPIPRRTDRRHPMRILAVLLAVSFPVVAQEHVHGADAGSNVPAHEKHPLDPSAPRPRGTMTRMPVGDQQSDAYVAKPQGSPKGAMLVVHEWWGLNDWVKHQADELAGQGYLALAIDLYQGQ